MFDLGWGELLLIGVIALIVVGPKDLPAMFRTLGRYTGKMRGMAREFQRAMNQAAEESGVRDVANEIKSTTSTSDMGLDALDNVAKRVKGSLRTSPGKFMATSAGLAAANLVKGDGKAAGEPAGSSRERADGIDKKDPPDEEMEEQETRLAGADQVFDSDYEQEAAYESEDTGQDRSVS